ncbi:UDP-glucosyltransferase 2-like [Colletes gigas]|uniref:UDP-glucosyltransferase 2-like n=1 Tax=Colletes gigas TaxID=935657 RepID=UPI001C9A9232|nr:UDP-glucosyltransferase 2-like [Colletes gigas]
MKLGLSILLTILACCQIANGLRILGIFPNNGKSHWLTGERLLKSLAERGHQVDAITHFPQKKPLPNYNEISMKGTLEEVVNNMNASILEKLSSTSVKHIIDMGSRVCTLLGHEKFQNLINNPPKDPPYDLVIVELFIAPCFLGFGRHLKVPMIGVIAANFHDWLSNSVGYPHNPSFMPALFAPFGQRMTFYERLVNTFITNTIAVQMTYYMNFQREYVKKYFNIDVPAYELHRDLSAVLVNSHHSLHGVKPTTPGVIEIGGLHVTEDSDPLAPEVKKWLDESKHGCVYVTFGSMMRIETFPESLQKTFYKVFEKLAPVRVLMKIAKKEELVPGLPKNVMTQSWFPQVAVFKHKNTKAFLTHGGLLGVQEAIYFGIPMIGIPLFGDQPTNLQNAASKNLAVSLGSLNNVTEETLTYAFDVILKNNTYRDNVKEVSRLFKDRPMSAVDTAVYWVEYVARNGNVLQSPAIYLSWWQLHLFDVYGFVLASIAVLLYVVIRVLRYLKELLFGSKSRSKRKNKSPESKKKN